MENSPLARLSPERRNKIYEYALPSHIVYIDCVPSGKHAAQRPLTKTCRQIRTETLSMDYANTSIELFTVDVGCYDSQTVGRAMAAWLRAIGPEACSTMGCIIATFSGVKQFDKIMAEEKRKGNGVDVFHQPLKDVSFLRGPYLRDCTRDMVPVLQKLGLRLHAVWIGDDYEGVWRIFMRSAKDEGLL